MRIAGIILIVLRLMAYASGSLKTSVEAGPYAVGYYAGANLMGIIGLILLIISIRTKKNYIQSFLLI